MGDIGTVLSRAVFARMRHIWLSSPDQGGVDIGIS